MKSLPARIPRIVSLFHRLSRARGPDGKKTPYLDELMLFLEDPPKDVRNRWKKGAQLCQSWGIECSASAVWRLYHAYVFEWRQAAANEEIHTKEPFFPDKESLQKFTAFRTWQALVNPRLSPSQIIHLARLACRKQDLELAAERLELDKTTKLDLGIRQFYDDVKTNRIAGDMLDKLLETLYPDREPEEAG